MIQLPYNNSAATMRFEIPLGWDVHAMTSLAISITNYDGGTLLAGTNTTLYTATTTNGAAAVGDSTITLDSGASAVVPGDRLSIAASAAGPVEEVEVQSYNSSTKVVSLKRELKFAHTSGAAVKGLWATYDLDTSTIATWTKGLQCVITWTPTGIDLPALVERAEVSVASFAFPDFAQRFEVLFPREWRIMEYRTTEILEEAFEHVQMDLSSRDFHIDRLVDTAMIRLPILYKARWLVVQSAGDNWEQERGVALDEYNRQIEIVVNQPLWLDENQDGVKDEIEVDDYSSFLGMERGI